MFYSVWKWALLLVWRLPVRVSETLVILSHPFLLFFSLTVSNLKWYCVASLLIRLFILKVHLCSLFPRYSTRPLYLCARKISLFVHGFQKYQKVFVIVWSEGRRKCIQTPLMTLLRHIELWCCIVECHLPITPTNNKTKNSYHTCLHHSYVQYPFAI